MRGLVHKNVGGSNATASVAGSFRGPLKGAFLCACIHVPIDDYVLIGGGRLTLPPRLFGPASSFLCRPFPSGLSPIIGDPPPLCASGRSEHNAGTMPLRPTVKPWS